MARTARKSVKKHRKSPKTAATKKKTKKARKTKTVTKPAEKVKTKPPASNASGQIMRPPQDGVKIRMYRHGHGDCFLLAFPGSDGEPVYVLIDCGYKPGSNVDFGLADMDTIRESIANATNKRLDLVVVTHEHQDHVNGFGKPGESPFDDFTIEEAWFAWTESPNDKLAIELRRRHGDQILGLVAARNQLAAASPDSVGNLDELLMLELGVNSVNEFAAAAADKKKDPQKSGNKQGMKLIQDKAGPDRTRYILPHRDILKIPGVDGVRVHALGPPYDADLLKDEDPQGSEAFPGHGFGARASFFAAVKAGPEERNGSNPFSSRFAIPYGEAFRHPQYGAFFKRHYGEKQGPAVAAGETDESASNANWRRIDGDWLFSAEELALVLNRGINNTSLVLAFELEKSGKVLLFVGDAQRGNWKSWTTHKKEHDKADLVRDLLGRTVLYKVGHHGSHNATLNGSDDSDYPCLDWMAQGKHADEFAAMITAVNAWAMKVKPKPWVHPLPSIKAALHKKAQGRVFQIDTPTVDKPQGVSAGDWQNFQDRVEIDENGLFFDYEVRN